MTLPFWGRIFSANQASAKVKSHDCGAGKETIQPYAKKQACCQPFPVFALIGGEPLQKAVHHQRNHQKETGIQGDGVEGVYKNPCKDSRQLSGTPGADGELFALPVKGTVRTAMTAEHNGKPFI